MDLAELQDGRDDDGNLQAADVSALTSMQSRAEVQIGADLSVDSKTRRILKRVPVEHTGERSKHHSLPGRNGPLPRCASPQDSPLMAIPLNKCIVWVEPQGLEDKRLTVASSPALAAFCASAQTTGRRSN